MKKKILFLILVMQILHVLPIIAQNQFIDDIIPISLKSKSLNSKNNDTINDYHEEQELINNYLKQININFSADNLEIIVDLINKKHFIFDIFYKNILVDKHRITLHPLSDTTMSITGIKLFNNDIITDPIISKKQAIEKLQLNNNSITEETILLNELVIYNTFEKKPYLCYKIEVLLSDIEYYRYYISAINGDIIDKYDLANYSTPTTGSAELINWGTKTINTSFKTLTNKYILHDQVANIHTYNAKGRNSTILAENFTDNDNNWTLTEFPETDTYNMNAALVCHWGARKTYDFFYNIFNRNGYDNKNGSLDIYVNYGGETEDGSSSKWVHGNKKMFIGNGRNELSLPHMGCVDIVAHEFGHAVTYSIANLTYRGECGSIMDGLSDIWAACVENYIGGQTFDEIWQLGDHSGTIIRNMSDPKDTNITRYNKQPNTYGGEYWVDPTNFNDEDNGGVHTNSGVLNYWFYLLTNGSLGINDNNELTNVNGVGFPISQQIVYQTLLKYIKDDIDYAQMRVYTLKTAADLYNDTSNVYKQVMNAWHAVGVGHPYWGNIEGDFQVCNNNTYSIYVHPAVSVTWSVDSFTNVMSQKRPKLTILSGQNTGTIIVERTPTGLVDTDGNYYYYNGDITLTATISYGNETHKIQKTLFVNTPLPDIKYTTRQVSNTSMNKIYKFYVNNVATDHLNWRIEANGSVYTATEQNYIEISLPTMRTYDVVVSVRDNGGCSDSNYKTRTLKGTSIVSPILSHENPVNTNSTFYLKKETDEYDDSATYNIEIWNDYGLVRSEKYDDAPEFMVSTDGLIPGVYFMRIYRNGEFLCSQKLIVK